MKHLNADVDGHQQEIVLAGTPSPKRNIRRKKLNMKQKKLASNLTWAVETFYRSRPQIKVPIMKTINQLIISNSHYVAPAGRVLIAFMFVMSGLNKMNNYSNTAGWMDAMDVPGNLLPLVIVLEVLGGAAIMIGWQTRIAAILFAAFSVMSAAIFHADLLDQNQMIHFMKNVSIAGGFLFLIVHGAGNYSLDSRKKARQR